MSLEREIQTRFHRHVSLERKRLTEEPANGWRAGEMVDHPPMVIDLNESLIRTLEQVRAVLDGTQILDFTPAADAQSRCDWIALVLRRLEYFRLKRADRGLVLLYLRRFSGFCRAQITRLVKRWLAGERLRSPRGAPSNAFARRYTEADLDALADVEREYGRLSGPATVAVLQRMYQVFHDERYVRLQHLSPSHLYNLRRSAAYRARHTVKTKTRSDPKGAAIAARRAPVPDNRPGFIRIDSVHQGNFRGKDGIYHINAVDCVTQWEVIATVPALTHEHMLPVLRTMLDQFPFKILGFHSDGGSEYINYDVAKMLENDRIDFTRSRPRRCNDNALAESKNGNVVRRQFGHAYVPAARTPEFNAFCKDYLNPFLNMHRPCLFGTEVPDPKKVGRFQRVHRQEDVMTPLDKLASPPDAQSFLREGITLEDLQQQARRLTDIEAARQVREAREKMMDQIAIETRPLYSDVWSFAQVAAARPIVINYRIFNDQPPATNQLRPGSSRNWKALNRRFLRHACKAGADAACRQTSVVRQICNRDMHHPPDGLKIGRKTAGRPSTNWSCRTRGPARANGYPIPAAAA